MSKKVHAGHAMTWGMISFCRQARDDISRVNPYRVIHHGGPIVVLEHFIVLDSHVRCWGCEKYIDWSNKDWIRKAEERALTVEAMLIGIARAFQ